jgi:beta-xylosidase
MRYFLCFFHLIFVTYSIGQTLVLPGDFPDPSVTKIGNSYWATATTSNWAPAYPLLQSSDLLHWELKGHVFNQLPAWADFYFWAPEISTENGKVYVYYAAHKRDGNLCVAVASADKPEGPYTDHGPLMCQEAGSIDAWPMRDENGKLYLIWKEDGNSIKRPTPIWAMEMNEARTRLVGDKKELFRNDTSWESNLVEGVSMIRHGCYFYAFYAGAGCCGRACSYRIGVARAENLLGPWEKYGKNPAVGSNDKWKCPGHGTPIEKGGKFYFLFHGYDSNSSVYAGRQGLLSEFTFTSDGWVAFPTSPASDTGSGPSQITDQFTTDSLSSHWQWSVFEKVNYDLREGRLELGALPEKPGAFIGQKTYTADYDATVQVLSKTSSAEAGLGLIGDEKNFVTASVKNKRITVRKVENEKETIVLQKQLKGGNELYLRLTVRNGKDIGFSCSRNGTNFELLNESPVDGFFLPPWDRAVRVALFSQGHHSEKAVFDNFSLKNK